MIEQMQKMSRDHQHALKEIIEKVSTDLLKASNGNESGGDALSRHLEEENAVLLLKLEELQETLVGRSSLYLKLTPKGCHGKQISRAQE